MFILQWNARSLTANGQEFKQYISTLKTKPDVTSSISTYWISVFPPLLSFSPLYYTLQYYLLSLIVNQNTYFSKLWKAYLDFVLLPHSCVHRGTTVSFYYSFFLGSIWDAAPNIIPPKTFNFPSLNILNLLQSASIILLFHTVLYHFLFLY